jgi:ABC-type glutathione transport system ATPase component
MNVPLLEVRDLEVWYALDGGGHNHAVRGISFTLDRGERLGLVGESGCGKTTALLALMGLLPPSATVSGQVLLNGTDLLAEGARGAAPSPQLVQGFRLAFATASAMSLLVILLGSRLPAGLSTRRGH